MLPFRYANNLDDMRKIEVKCKNTASCLSLAQDRKTGQRSGDRAKTNNLLRKHENRTESWNVKQYMSRKLFFLDVTKVGFVSLSVAPAPTVHHRDWHCPPKKVHSHALEGNLAPSPFEEQL